MLVGGKLACQHRGLLREAYRNVHFALVATCAPALQSTGVEMWGIWNLQTNIKRWRDTSGSMLCHWEVGWQWRDRGTPKGCVCCGTIGVSFVPVTCPPFPPVCPTEALRIAEQQESSALEQTGPTVHHPHNSTTTHPTLIVIPNISTHGRLHMQAHNLRQTPQNS